MTKGNLSLTNLLYSPQFPAVLMWGGTLSKMAGKAISPIRSNAICTTNKFDVSSYAVALSAGGSVNCKARYSDGGQFFREVPWNSLLQVHLAA